MLAGCEPWPHDVARRYRDLGYWQGITLIDLLARAIQRAPDKTALVHGGERISYSALGETVDRLACGFLASGIRPLERVVVQLPNIPEFVYTYFALARIGAIPVTALRAHRHTEVGHFLRASGAIAYVISDAIKGFDYRAMAQELAPKALALRAVFVVGEPAVGQHALSKLLATPADASALATLRPDPSEVATMLLSGGTTSLSKLIPRTHDDYVLNARLCGAAGGFDDSTVLMAILPLGHNYNLASPGMLGAFYYGGTVVLAPSGEAADVFGLVERERVTTIAAVMPLISGWLASDAPDRFDLSSLEVIQNGGARLAPELRSRLRERFGCTPQEIYGTAEGLINMTRLDDPDDLLLESSGTPVCADDEIMVVDDDGREVADGVSGELLTRGPYTIRSYYNAPERNREAFTEDGFYRMGDIVRRQGRHVFTEGRRKDLINRGGEKISCEEVENLIYAHPKVKVVTLVAMPDLVFGEKACAFVVPKPGETLAFDELIAFLRQQRIASFKLPERLEIVAELPLSPVGKILKRELREMITAKLAREAREGRHVNIGIVGGGPAGLFFAYLMKRHDPGHRIRIVERDPAAATYGWGVVFTDIALAFVREAAPELYAALTRNQEVHDAMRIVHRGQAVTLANNTFHRMARIDLLRTLREHCSALGIAIEFGRKVDDIGEFGDCDLVVAADGAGSAIRTRYREHFGPALDVRPNLLAWYGTTARFDPLSLVFRENDDGLLIAHAYRYSRSHSTFLVECDPRTWRAAGLDRMSEAQSLAYCEHVFGDDLDGQPLLSNRSEWFRYAIVSNRRWHWRNLVLLGDALRTGHPSVGSGTRLAMQDSIALFEACVAFADVPAQLAEFERRRRPGSDALQDAAIRSTLWYESVRTRLSLDPVSFAYDYLRRTGRVDHQDVRARDPALASAYEALHPEGVPP